jgi:hypothetical protein
MSRYLQFFVFHVLGNIFEYDGYTKRDEYQRRNIRVRILDA